MVKIKCFDYSVSSFGRGDGGASGMLEISDDFYTVTKALAVPNFITFDGLGIDLSDFSKHFYQAGDYVGYISSDASDESGGFSYQENQAPYLELYNSSVFNEDPITIVFTDNEVGAQIKWYENRYPSQEEPDWPSDVTYETSHNGEMCIISPVPWKRVKIAFTGTEVPHSTIKICKIFKGNSIIYDKLKNVSLLEETNILSDDLPISKLEFTMMSNSAPLQNQPVNVYSNNRYYGSFFVDETKKEGKNNYSVTAYNIIKKLDQNTYRDWDELTKFGRYSGNTGTQGIIDQIEAPFKINIHSDVDLHDYGAFGYIPIKSFRYALCAYGFACGLMIDATRSDTITLKTIPKEISHQILNSDKRIIGTATFETTTPPASITVVYPSDYSLSEDTQIATFPKYGYGGCEFDNAPFQVDIDSIGGNFSIGDKSYNYISISYDEGFGNQYEKITLSGYKITLSFLSETTEGLSSGSENKEYRDFQLRGRHRNGSSIDEISRIPDMENVLLSRGTVKAKIRLRGEKVGDLVSIETDCDGIITGIITSMNIQFGYEDIADIEVFEWPAGTN